MRCCLNSSNGIIACKEISRGVVNATEVGIRMLVEAAIKSNAAAVIIAHNHPGALPLPSKEDEYCTRSCEESFGACRYKIT